MTLRIYEFSKVYLTDLHHSVRRRSLAQRVQSGAGPLWSVKPCREDASDHVYLSDLDCPHPGPPLPSTQSHPVPFFDAFFHAPFGRNLRGPKSFVTSPKTPLGANLCDFAPQLGGPNGAKTEASRAPRAHLC